MSVQRRVCMCMRGVAVGQLLPLEQQLDQLLTQKGSKQTGSKQAVEEETQRELSENIPVPIERLWGCEYRCRR